MKSKINKLSELLKRNIKITPEPKNAGHYIRINRNGKIVESKVIYKTDEDLKKGINKAINYEFNKLEF